MHGKKWSVGIIGFILILTQIAVGATCDIATFLSLVVSAIIAFSIGLKITEQYDPNTPFGILLLLTFQNICIGFPAHVFNNQSENLKYLTQIPFMTLAIVFFMIIVSKNSRNSIKQKKAFTLLVAAIVVSFILGRGSLQAVLMNVRNLTTFYMAFTIGRYSIRNRFELMDTIRHFMVLMIVIFISGIILQLGGFELYEHVGLREVYIAKGSPITGTDFSGRFTTTLYKKQHVRMGSILFEPINLAYMFALGLIMSVFEKYKNSRSIVDIIVCLLGLLLTFGKGGYMIVASAILMFSITKFIYAVNRIQSKSLNIGLIIGTIMMILFSIAYYINIGASANTHFWAIERTWHSVLQKPFGHGIGTGGNMSYHFNNENNENAWLESGGETAFMAFLYQIGVQGGAALLYALLSIMLDKRKVLIKNSSHVVFYYIPVILLGMSLMQDNTFTPQCIAPYMLMLGGYSSTLCLKGENE